MENKKAHLEMIQSVVTRMASNSSGAKNQCVTIVAVIGALAVVRSNAIMFLLMLIPIISFWALDARYLRQEQLFRALYNSVRHQPEDKITFTMDTTPFKKTTPPLWKCVFWNWSTTPFYLAFFIVFLVVFLVAMASNNCICMGG